MVCIRQTVCDRVLYIDSTIQGVVDRQFHTGRCHQRNKNRAKLATEETKVVCHSIYIYLFKQLMLYNFMHLIFASFYNYTYCF